MGSYTRNIEVPGKSASEIYQKISTDIDRFLENYAGNFGKFDVRCDPEQKSVTLHSSMATAKLTCGDGQIVLDGKLGLLASAFKAKIDDGINRWLKKTFQI
jgi:hypothetical protein